MDRCEVETIDGHRVEVDAVLSSVDGVVITDPCGGGTTWQLTHTESGKRISPRTWPTFGEADTVARECLSALDWTGGADTMTDAHAAAASACSGGE